MNKHLKALHIRFLPEQTTEENISSRQFLKQAEFINIEQFLKSGESESGSSSTGGNSGTNTGGTNTGGSENTGGDTGGGNSGGSAGFETGGE